MLNFNLDLQKQDNFSKAFTARMGDVGEQFSVTLFDNQTPYTPVNGDVVSFRVVTPSGKFASVAGTMSGNKATFTLNGQITSEAGYYQRAYVAVSNGTKLRTTQDLIFFSLGNSDINRGQADYYVAELDKLLQQLNEEFDQWLIDREADYSDLLARIVALTNRMTGLETKLDDIIAQLQANMINTTNLFTLSQMSQPENATHRRINGTTFDINSWGATLYTSNELKAMGLEPNKTYHIEYLLELITLNGGQPVQNNRSQGSLSLYPSDTSKYDIIYLGGSSNNDFNDLPIGGTVARSATFTTPDYFNEAGYRILAYSRRDVNGVVDTVRFHKLMLQEGSMYTGYQIDPDEVLTNYDKDRLKQNLHPDPMMTGTVPIANKDSAVTLTWTTNGWLDVKNTDTANTRRFWYDPVNDLNIPQANVTRPLSVSLKIQLNNGASITVGYASGENIVYTSTSDTDWVWVTGIVKSTGSTGLSVYLSPNASLKIQQFDIYYAEITQSSRQLDKITPIELATIAIPDTLQNPNANTLTQSGRWKVYAGTNMPPLPTSSGSYYFYLEVIQFNSDNCIQHAYLRYSGSPSTANGNYEYSRQLVNGSWGPWQRYELETTDGNNFSKTGADLNNEIIGGKYIYINPTSAPKSGTFYGEVIRYGGAYIMQRLTNINATDETFQRVCINTAWQPWRKVSIVPATGNINQQAAMDFNTVTDSGNFMNVSATLNCPNNETGSTWYVEVIKYSSNYLYQRATKVAASNATYDRQLLNGVWQPWQQITKTTT